MAVNLSEKARTILNDPYLISVRDKKMAELTEFFKNPDAPKTVNDIPFIAGKSVWRGDDCDENCNLLDPEECVLYALEYLADQAHIAGDETMFRPLCMQYATYGVHFMDNLLGSEVFRREGEYYNKYLTSEVGTLEYPDLDSHPLWIFSKKVLEAFLEADVKLVYFGLPTIASPLNIAINLYGQEFLCAMLEDPDAAKHDLEIIANLCCDIHKYYIDHLPEELLQPVIGGERTQPFGCGQICGCSTHLISKSLYDDLVAPLDEKILKVYRNPGLIHLCGSHRQHIETFRNMKHLRVVQLNDTASEDLQYYYDGLRDDQIIYFIPCKKLTIDDAMRITDGRRMVITAATRPV